MYQIAVKFTSENTNIQTSLEIVAKPDGLYARDMGSANGTWLNGRQLSGELVLIRDNAEIQLGPDTMLNFRVS
jgi:pSer/pThr/pTyr-binding forkhead associated (FHA) protein